MTGGETDAMAVRETLRNKDHFAVLMERYEAKLERYIRRLGVRNQEDRTDILQDIFIKVYRNLHAFDQSLSFSSWIYRIAHNETMSWFRKRMVRPENTLVDDGNDVIIQIGSGEADAEASLIKQEDSAEVRRAIEKLKPQYRDMLVLAFLEEKTYEEISDILEMPIGTVGTYMHRAKKQLREILQTS